ncbi:hypothetical protein VC83_02243 [Pseudogymnoascus destructans]|nr:uncharacterized protein VC83_02243 [Pseudogymnoascus destructans]OAF61358.1 hypothetical protein VC83_02243 [Pseudogymnoascus destructans]
MGKKSWVGLLICLYTFVVYSGSAIYTSSIPQVIQKFNLFEVDAYGIGLLVFSPLSEILRIGRSPVYLVTMFIFTIISIPTALVNNFAGLLILRFLQGFFGSPWSSYRSRDDEHGINALPPLRADRLGISRILRTGSRSAS